MQRHQVRIDELKKLPYVRNLPTDTRIQLLRPFYDHRANDWIFYVPIAGEGLQRLAGGEPVVGSYLAEQAADPKRDVVFPLGTFVTQFASYEGVVGALISLESDLFGLASILRKYDLIVTTQQSNKTAVRALLSSELEYLIIHIRSLYDVLQKLSKNLTRYVRDLNDPTKRVIDDLDDSFASVVFKGEQARSREEIEARYRLPTRLAQFYADEWTHFKKIRDLRVRVEHYGETVSDIFCIDSGAGVLYAEAPWNQFGPWEGEQIRLGRFGSLRLLFTRLVADAFNLTTRYLVCVCIPRRSTGTA